MSFDTFDPTYLHIFLNSPAEPHVAKVPTKAHLLIIDSPQNRPPRKNLEDRYKKFISKKKKRSPNAREMAVLRDGTKSIGIDETNRRDKSFRIEDRWLGEGGGRDKFGQLIVSTLTLFKALFKIIGGEIWMVTPHNAHIIVWSRTAILEYR